MARLYQHSDTIKNIIKKTVGSDNQFRFNIQIYLIDKYWEEIIGSKLYHLTMPKNIYKQCLYVSCKHQGLIQTLQFYKTDLLKKINCLYQAEILFRNIEIKNIKFVYGQVKHINYGYKVKKNNPEKKKEPIKTKEPSFDKIAQNLEKFFLKSKKEQ